MANTTGAKVVVVGIGVLGAVAALAVLWSFSLVVCIMFGWSPLVP
ncbi:hypothetical protein AB0C96_17000 [Streptomyces sp. NPDC048506]